MSDGAVENAATAASERIFATNAALTSTNQDSVGAEKSFWDKRFLVY
ncbi:hypothetical protein ABIB82_002117 [Bradyrhizobium sp. i1.8.4]